MPSHLETVLKEVGVPDADVATIIAMKDTDTFDAKPIVEKVRGNFRTQFQNDPTFFDGLTVDKLPADTKKKIETDQYGRATGIVKQKFAKLLGFDIDNLPAELTTEQREKFETFVPALAELWSKTKSGDKVTQEQLIAARRELEEFKGIEEKLKTKYETEGNQKVSAGIFNAVMLGELAQLDLKISASDIANTASSVLLSKYGFEKVGDYGIELRQKDNPKMKVLIGQTSKEMTVRDALKEIAKERGWLNEEADDKDDKKGGGKFKVDKDKNGSISIIPPHLQSVISNKIAAEK